MNKLIFFIKPTAKARPRAGRNGFYTPAKTAEFESKIKIIAKQQNPKIIKGSPVWVSITFTFAATKKKTNILHSSRPDLDNLVKAVCDALNGIAWEDDGQIAILECCKRYADNNTIPPSIEVVYSEVEG